MLVRKKKEYLLKKKSLYSASAPEENLQTLRSWIRKIEQTTTSVSSRLSAVEKRLSVGMSDAQKTSPIGMKGPIQTLFLNVKKKNTGELARVLDGELALLHNELVNQEQEAGLLKEQLEVMEKKTTVMAEALQTMQKTIEELNVVVAQRRVRRSSQQEPLVMHVGAFEVPVEFTGIIGGLLVFLVALLVVCDQKSVLLSPLFLFGVGSILIGFAFVKMIRSRVKNPLRPNVDVPLKTQSASITPVPCKQKEG
jgi:hypothetical protein